MAMNLIQQNQYQAMMNNRVKSLNVYQLQIVEQHHQQDIEVESNQQIVSLQQIPSIIRMNPSFTSIDGPHRLYLAAFGLGLAVMFGILIMLMHPYSIPWPFGAFVTLWAMFHWMEFTMTAIFHPDDLTFTCQYTFNHNNSNSLDLSYST